MIKNMMKSTGIFSILLFSFIVVSAATFTETFDNSSATSSYSNNSFLGNNDITWSFIEARNEDAYAISGNGLMLRDLTSDSKTTSGIISGGISDFSVQLKKGFTGTGPRQVELLINGISKGTSTIFDDTSTHIFSINNINIEGDFTMELRNTQNNNAQIVIDNIVWADYNGSSNDNDDYNFCEVSGKVGDLKFKDISFNNLGEGEDDDWYLLDEIEIEVEVENTNKDESVRDVIVEIMILDSDGNDVTSDFEFDDETIDLSTVKKDDSEIATFRIKEVPADLDDGSYKVYIKAYSDNKEEEQCVAESKDLNNDLYQSIDVTREEDPAVIIKQSTIPIISASCGDKQVELTVEVYNIGSDKEDKVLITLKNSQLNIDEKQVIDNLRSGKRKEATFFFDIPKELSRNSYTLDLITYYDYDKDEDELEIQSYSESSFNDLDKKFQAKLEILSCGIKEPTINANLVSEATLGKELDVEVTITNNGPDNNFVFSVANFESWANLISVTPQTAIISEGNSQQVLIKFMPTIEGIHTFDIGAIVDGETYEQPVSVNISSKPSIFAGVDNTLLYIIIAIIAVLIIIFLILIIKLSRQTA